MSPHAPPKNGSTSNGSATRSSLRLIHALIDQARRWTNHAITSSKLDPAYVVEKALAAIGRAPPAQSANRRGIDGKSDEVVRRGMLARGAGC